MFPFPRLPQEFNDPMRAFFKFSLGWCWRWRQQCHTFAYLTMNNYSFARFVRVFYFYFSTICCRSRPFHDVKWCVSRLQLCARREDIMRNFHFFFFLSSNRWYLFYSTILRRHFAGQMTWNNWEMITETGSSIFRWRSRCCRRCPRLEFWSFFVFHPRT